MFKPLTSDSASTPGPVISVDGLTKRFKLGLLGTKTVNALRGISFEVKRGTSFGFLGPNGAGKTTSIKILNGLIFPSGGKANVFGLPPGSTEAKRRLGYLPENPSFHDHLTGREVLEFACGFLHMERARRAKAIADALEMVKLSHAADLQVRRYSKGMTQRLGIAQAIVHEPELVILDEPMSGLDPVGRRDVKDLMIELRRSGRTVFFSTHIISDVEEICDEVAIVVGGKLVRYGQVTELLSSQAREVEIVASDVPPNFGERVETTTEGVATFRAADEQKARQLIERLWSVGAKVVAMKTRRYSLEDIFMEEVARPALPHHRFED